MMANVNSLLTEYQTLMQVHVNHFDPMIAALHELVQTRMQEIYQQERTLFEAQVLVLQQILEGLAVDARQFLAAPEFRAFVQSLNRPSSRYGYSHREPVTVPEDPQTWLVAALNVPVSISNYQLKEDPDGYDDERNHIVYSYSLTLRLGDKVCEIEVETKRIYNINEQIENDIKEQVDSEIASQVKYLVRETERPEAELQQLAVELSFLVGYASTLFTLKPRTAKFSWSENDRPVS
jgi:hypothetical protein